MVLAPTILSDAIGVTLTYRRTCLDQHRATALVDRFIDLLMTYAGHTIPQGTSVVPTPSPISTRVGAKSSGEIALRDPRVMP